MAGGCDLDPGQRGKKRTFGRNGWTIVSLSAARRFFENATERDVLPEKVTVGEGGADTATLEALKEETGAKIEIRQITYLIVTGEATEDPRGSSGR